MTFIKLALDNPVATLVGCLLATVFGAVALTKLPIQLTPEVEQPEIVITTTWRAAAPEEVESEIIEPQEKQLRGLPGMRELLSEASNGSGKITITFEIWQVRLFKSPGRVIKDGRNFLHINNQKFGGADNFIFIQIRLQVQVLRRVSSFSRYSQPNSRP